MTVPAVLHRIDVGTAGRGRLLDRDEERAALGRVLAGARAGAGGALVLRGAPGIGRTFLLEDAVGMAGGMRVAWLAGIESEMGLGFAGLHRLLSPIGPELDRLPRPQRTALHAAFGRLEADPPDCFLVGLAVLALLAEAAAGGPLLLVVDDAQWLDQVTVEVLAFVARRLAAAPIAFVLAVREPTNRCRALDGLPTRRLGGLSAGAAHELLAQATATPLDPRVARRIVAETGGNPLALVEFGRQVTDGRWATGRPLSEPLPISARLSSQFLRWVRTLPSRTQKLMLLIAATEPGGSPAVMRRAADRLGLGRDVAEPADLAGLLSGCDRAIYANPLVRSAVYHGVSPGERRRVHAAVAAVLDPATDADARAWHLAAAADGPDEAVAGELADSAARAAAGADHAAEAMLLARAAEMTPDRHLRAGRLLAAAGAELAADRPARAESLLDQGAPELLDAPARVRTAHLRATLSLAYDRFREAPAALLQAAHALRPAHPGQARRALLDAMYAGLVAGEQAENGTLHEIVQAVRQWPAESPPTTADLLLDAFATRLSAGHQAAAPALRAGLDALVALVAGPARDESPYLLAVGCWAAGELLDGDAQRVLVGRWQQAAGDGLPGLSVPDPVGVSGDGELLPPGWTGQETAARAAIAGRLRVSAETGAGLGVLAAQYATGVLELALGHYDAALTATLSVYRADPPSLGTYVLPDLVEAAARGGNLCAARAAAERLAGRVPAGATPQAVGLLARSRAMLAAGTEAEELYLEAIERLRQAAEPVQLARTHLLYGEWLRRQRRRRDARQQLGTARDLFDHAGLDAFAQRSRAELIATGERGGKRTGEAADELTPQEIQVARLVVDGASNRQVAAQLFITTNTVEYHLQKVFRKAGVSSRTQLARAWLSQEPGTGRLRPAATGALAETGGSVHPSTG
jgi:DNA-binding CsgD family transcriptional regulator